MTSTVSIMARKKLPRLAAIKNANRHRKCSKLQNVLIKDLAILIFLFSLTPQIHHKVEEEEEEIVEYSVVSCGVLGYQHKDFSSVGPHWFSRTHTALFAAGIKVNLHLYRSTDDQNGLSLYDAVTHNTPVRGVKSLVYSI